ncbi:hypothetical protein TZ53_02020 [Sphingobium sp. YBL2]|nr:hypothetical protein TZ53_02020 [Sphingobium sp. YBL2]
MFMPVSFFIFFIFHVSTHHFFIRNLDVKDRFFIHCFANYAQDIRWIGNMLENLCTNYQAIF